MSKTIKKRIFAIENFFDLSKNKNNQKIIVNIPLLQIYKNKKSAILIDKDSDFFSEKNYLNKLVNNDNCAYVLNDIQFSNQEYDVYFGKNNLKKKIAFFDIEEIYNSDKNIPIFEIWKKSLDFDDFYEEEHKQFHEVIKRNELTFKSSIFRSLNYSSEKIIPLNDEFTKELGKYATIFKEKWFAMTEEEFLKYMDELEEIFEEYKKDSLSEFFKFYNEIFENYRRLSDLLKNKNSDADSEEIQMIKTKLKHLREINNTSLRRVENNYKIRDLKSEIKFFQDLMVELKNRSVKYKNSITYKIEKAIKSTQEKMSLLNSFSEEYLHLYKILQIKKRSLALWRHHSHKIKYLKVSKIWDLYNSIQNEELLFINNNLAALSNPMISSILTKIKRKVRSEFKYDFSTYIDNSHSVFNEITKEITSRQTQISRLKKLKFETVSDSNKFLEQQKYDYLVKMYQAEDKWNKKSKDRLFKNTLKNYSPKLKRFVRSIRKNEQMQRDALKIIKESIIKKAKSLNKLNDYSIYINEKLDTVLNYQNFPLINSFIVELVDFCLNKSLKTLSSKFINIFNAANKMVSAMSYISVNFSNYLIPYDDIQIINKIKLKLINVILQKPVILFVQDNVENTSFSQRNEFLRVLNVLTKENNIHFVLVTRDWNLVRTIFDAVYIFYQNNLIEGGLISDIIENPIHAYTQFLVDPKKVHNIYSFDNNLPWVYNEVNYVDDYKTHYVCANYENFQKWTQKDFQCNTKKDTELRNIDLKDVDRVLKPVIRKHEVAISNFDKALHSINVNSNLFVVNDRDLSLLNELKDEQTKNTVNINDSEVDIFDTIE
ncbi:hypothetical protein V2E24_01275 [Mycoplasmopsis ciconiae]|uniref:ABC transporter ATP-binding protein n=1 Tax=Mycoplasmopsis ciconiae TaxID=561067 RepID=A0ABU7ML69_9BACT|nr:hypothetical protein [Mycoplasmopsis ciconiae]